MLLMGKSTIPMAIFNSYVSLPEGIDSIVSIFPDVNFPSSYFAASKKGGGKLMPGSPMTSLLSYGMGAPLSSALRMDDRMG